MYKYKTKLIATLLASLASSQVMASGFQLLEQNAAGIGNAYSGTAASAENASTVFYNPAGMTQLAGTNASAGITAIQPSFKFSNGASNGGSLVGDGGDGGRLGFVPNAYLSTAITKDLYLGLGINAPFGLKTDYDTPWIGGAQSLMFDIKTLNINPSIAYRASETVSLGFGLDWQKLDAKYKRIAGTAVLFPGVIDLTKATSLMDISSDAWGWNAGVLFNLSPMTKVGVSYRSAIKHKATGDITLSSDGSGLGASTVAALTPSKVGNVSADVKLPDTWILSATHKLDDRWELLGDLARTGWSSIPKIDIVYTSGGSSGTIAQTLHTDFRDTWRIAAGANYRISDALKLKFGLAYDQAPVKKASTRLVSLPDNDRTWFSLGAQWQPAKGSTVDIGAAYLYIKDPVINADQTTTAQGLVNGTYKASAWLLGAQYSIAF